MRVLNKIQSPLANIPNSTNPSAGAILEVKCLHILANYLNFTYASLLLLFSSKLEIDLCFIIS